MEKKPKLNVRIAEQFVRTTVFYSLIDDRYIHIIHEKDENLVGLRYFRSINHKIYILTQIPEIIPPNLLHCGHNLTCDRLLMLPGTIT